MADRVDLLGLYLVTDRKSTRGRPLLDVVAAALRGGVDAVQLREKDLPARQLHDLAKRLRELCTSHGAHLLINDRIDIASAVNADGVQLPASSFDPADARRLLGAGKLIGVSTHNVTEADAAERAGADFVVFGPIFDTPSKRAHGTPVGMDALGDVTTRLRIPVVAIGGITLERVAAARECRAAGVAVIAGILQAEDPEAAARAYKVHLQGEPSRGGQNH